MYEVKTKINREGQRAGKTKQPRAGTSDKRGTAVANDAIRLLYRMSQRTRAMLRRPPIASDTARRGRRTLLMQYDRPASGAAAPSRQSRDDAVVSSDESRGRRRETTSRSSARRHSFRGSMIPPAASIIAVPLPSNPTRSDAYAGTTSVTGLVSGLRKSRVLGLYPEKKI